MSFNHSIRIVKKIEGRNISGLRLSKLSALSDTQRCIVYNKATAGYGEIENYYEKFDSPSISIKKIGKSLEIVSKSLGVFFVFLSKLPFQDDKIVDFADAYNEFFVNGQFVACDSGKLDKLAEYEHNDNKIVESQGIVAEAMRVEKEKDAIILYINIHDNLGEIPIDEDVVFGIFEDMAKKYNLGIIYDGFKEDLDEQKI